MQIFQIKSKHDLWFKSLEVKMEEYKVVGKVGVRKIGW